MSSPYRCPSGRVEKPASEKRPNFGDGRLMNYVKFNSNA